MFDRARNNAQAVAGVLNIALRARRAEISAEIARVTGGRVQAGPFAGMQLMDDISWLDGDTAPKTLGCYEQELHDAIEAAIGRQPDVVVNVGCAEGYYAVGLARRLPQARTFAFDIDAKAQDVCRKAAHANGVGDRVTVGGLCTPAVLADLCQGHRALVVMDCEGNEMELLSDASIPALARADILVECHDLGRAPITETLRGRLEASHTVENRTEGARDPNAFPILRTLASQDRWLTVCEFRPMMMNWLVCTPRSGKK